MSTTRSVYAATPTGTEEMQLPVQLHLEASAAEHSHRLSSG